MRPNDMEGRTVEKPVAGMCHVCGITGIQVGHAMNLGAMINRLSCTVTFSTEEGLTCQLCLLKAANALVHIMIDEEMRRLIKEASLRDVDKN